MIKSDEIMALEEFICRHNSWNPEANKEQLLDEVIQCIKESKKTLDVQIRGNVLYSDIDPEHFVEDLIAKFLSMEFPKYMIMLQSPRGTFIAGKNVAGVVRTNTEVKKLIKKIEK